MIIFKYLGLLLIAAGSAPLWEKLVKFAFDVEYNFVAEWSGFSNDALVPSGLVLILVGVALQVLTLRKKA